MPVNKAHNLEKLVQACREYPESRKRITFEYILIRNLTDFWKMQRLIRLLHGGIRSQPDPL